MIKIKATDLKPGHIIQRGGGPTGRVMVLAVGFWETDVNIHAVTFGTPGPVSVLQVKTDDDVWIEPPELTPAQARADELREMLWICANHMRHRPDLADVEQAARKLLDEIDPPAPPTLEEVLQALIDAENWIEVDAERYENGPENAAQAGKNATDIINRARRAGIIK